ncbi:glycosyltransferase [Aquimarina sp. AD10]|uniref:glycosyltransferase n=1 Tax=Aquimarina sp. AD10 TaxID=1714849 RepID=UPI000E4EE0F8|nr:glycosyltransferase [Aquimarina sp. AD10]AXT61830.1 glycosyltransferase [Aquimarina sp. AD10]RKN02628.1 glycosyltransferase [Aquimarina sp. AD10]
MKKVCHLTSVHGRYDNRIFFKECCSLASNGYKVCLIVADGNGDEVLDGVEIYDVGSSSGRFNRFFKATKKVYKKAVELNADVYHFHDPELIPSGLKLKSKNKKVVYDVHEDYRTQIRIKPWINKFLRRVISFSFAKYEDYAMKRFDALLMPQTRMVESFNHLNEKTEFIANSIIIDNDFDLNTKDYHNKLCFHPGTLSKERGVLNMINALGYLNEGKLILAGKFGSEKLFEASKSLEGWSKVDYLGKRPYSEIKEYHKQATVGLILFENVGQSHYAYTVKLFEYMYFGIPVIMPNFGDWVDFNEQYNCGINVNPDNPKAVSDQIKYLNNNPDLKRELGNNGRKAVEESLNWENEEIKLIRLYNSLN